jgi:hypothetical protein
VVDAAAFTAEVRLPRHNSDLYFCPLRGRHRYSFAGDCCLSVQDRPCSTLVPLDFPACLVVVHTLAALAFSCCELEINQKPPKGNF